MSQRYGNRYRRAIINTGIVALLSLVICVLLAGLVYLVAPQPFRAIVYGNFLRGKFYAPLLRVLESAPIALIGNSLPTYEISINRGSLDLLESDMKQRDRTWYNAYLSINNFRNVPIQVKIRGETQQNWIGPKKSLWVRTRAGAEVNGWTKNTFRNLKGSEYILESLAEAIAKQIGLLTSRANPVNVFINRQFRGVFLESEELDERFLAKSRLPAGDIYSLDELEFTAKAFFNVEYWKKRANNPKALPDNKDTLKLFLQCVKDKCAHFKEMVALDQFLKNLIVFELLGSNHLDQFHNHRIYLNPVTKKFEPIVWDINHSRRDREYNQSYDYISQLLLMDPKIRQKKMEMQQNILRNITTDKFINNFFHDYILSVGPGLRADKYFGHNWSYTYHEILRDHENLRKDLLERRRNMLNDTGLDPAQFELGLNQRGEQFLYANSPLIFEIVKIELQKKSAVDSVILETQENRRVIQLKTSGAPRNKVFLAAKWVASDQFEHLGIRNQEVLSGRVKKIPLLLKISAGNNLQISGITVRELISRKSLKIIKKDKILDSIKSLGWRGDIFLDEQVLSSPLVGYLEKGF